MTRVKICGIKTTAQARAALDAGADFLGFVFYRPSHRFVEPALAAEIASDCRASHGDARTWQALGVFVDEPLDVVNAIVAGSALDIAQLCGAEDAVYCQSVRVPVLRSIQVGPDGSTSVDPRPDRLGAWKVLLDAKVDGLFGGTGRTYPWCAVREAAAEGFIAGGLNVTNVSDAIAQARPWAVDVSGGVERGRVKDPALIREFIEEVRRVDRHVG